MARRRSVTSKALSASHLRAIGKVAATWSALELTMLNAIADAAKLDLRDAIILVGSQNVAQWCEVLKKLTGDSNEFLPRQENKQNKKSPLTQLDVICATITKLQPRRNQVVHTYWRQNAPEQGLYGIGSPQSTTGKLPAVGVSIPKRGNKVILSVAMNSRDMLSVARDTEEARRSLLAWMGQRKQVLTLRDLLQAPPANSTPATSQKQPRSQPKPSRP